MRKKIFEKISLQLWSNEEDESEVESENDSDEAESERDELHIEAVADWLIYFIGQANN